MRTHALGAGVTAIGCGEVSLAVAADRGVDARMAERALHHAIELGLTLVEVRDEPDAERLVGEAIRVRRARDRVVVATRVPLVPPRPGAPRRDRLPELLPLGYLQERIEATLRTTRLDAVPLAQLPLHAAWRESAAWPALVDTCGRLIREGKVLAWGALIDEVDADACALAREPWLAAVSVRFSLCDRTAEPVIAAATARSVPVLARRPLAGGALTGNLGPGVKLPPRDDRAALSATELEAIAVAVARLAAEVTTAPPAARSCEAARAIVERARRPDHVEATTLAELALRFVIDRGAIALPRLHRHETILEAVVACAAPPLSAALRERITTDAKPGVSR